MEIAQYRLAKITYIYNIKEFNKIKEFLYKQDSNFIEKLFTDNISISIHRRNSIVDWIWLKEENLNKLLSILDNNDIRYNLVNHTETYLYTPEKLSTLREEIDKKILEFINIDFVLDRITEVGLENISKLEKKFLNENYKNI
jgi:hypothetical protein